MGCKLSAGTCVYADCRREGRAGDENGWDGKPSLFLSWICYQGVRNVGSVTVAVPKIHYFHQIYNAVSAQKKKKYLDVDYCAEVDTSTLQFYISHVLLNVLPFSIPISLFLSPPVLHFTESNFLSNMQSLESCLSTTSGSNKLFHRGLTIAKHLYKLSQRRQNSLRYSH